MDLARCLLPDPDKGSQTQGCKGGHKNRRNTGIAGLSKHISDTSQVSLLQVYFSSSAFSQKVSRKQLRGSFINVFCLPLSAHALPLCFLFPRHGGGRGVPTLPSPRCHRDETWKPEGFLHPQIGVRLSKVSDGDISDPGSANTSPPTPIKLMGEGVELTSGRGYLARGWPP